MAKYYTDTTELTSIANAIRAKTGDSSSLVYPTGFVTEIGKLSKYNWIGDDAKLLHSYSEEVTLSDTSLASYTPSSSNTIIINGDNHYVDEDTLSLSRNYDYIIIEDAYINFQYSTSPSTAHVINYSWTGSYVFGARPNTLNDLINDNYNYVTYTSINSMSIMTVIQNNGNSTISGNSYGIHCTSSSPSLSNQGQENFSCRPRHCFLRANANNAYMAAESYANLDLSNSKAYFNTYLYRTSRDSIYHGTWARLKNIYNTHNTNT